MHGTLASPVDANQFTGAALTAHSPTPGRAANLHFPAPTAPAPAGRWLLHRSRSNLLRRSLRHRLARLVAHRFGRGLQEAFRARLSRRAHPLLHRTHDLHAVDSKPRIGRVPLTHAVPSG